jgi:hypothetical protein
MSIVVDLSGDYGTTIYDVARRLLEEGADSHDTVETRRGSILSMSGVIGELAKWTIEERRKGGLRLAPWKPFPRSTIASRTGKRQSPVHSGRPP